MTDSAQYGTGKLSVAQQSEKTPNLHFLYDLRVSALGLSARLIQWVKRGADHLGFINTQVTKSLVVPFWRPSPVTSDADNTH